MFSYLQYNQLFVMGEKNPQPGIATSNIVLLKSSNIFIVVKASDFYLIASLFQMGKLDTFVLKEICQKKGTWK